jgi:hypothetical protein
MVVVRKILAVVAMILCAGVLLVCLAGAVGVWVARVPLTRAAVALLSTTRDSLLGVANTAQQVSQGLGELQDLSGKVNDAVSGLSEGAGVLRQIGPIGDAVNGIADGVQQLDSRLAGLQADTGEIQSQAGNLAAQANHLRQRIPAWIGVGAIVATLLLLWVGLGQIGLFFHALQWFREPGC